MSRSIYGVCAVCGMARSDTQPAMVVLSDDYDTMIFYCHECARSGISTLFHLWITTGAVAPELHQLDFSTSPPPAARVPPIVEAALLP
ncbi:MAG: hypothetical protein JSV86_10515 [Gemmatimonadota bacterium]|nr:MAG: hypothetical protein JSV86_10515 [Gemmatimonadota bacterium]